MRSNINLTHSFVILLLTFAACYSQSSNSAGGYRAGYYKGKALNTTANAHGNAGFELYDINRQNGQVRAYAIFSDGLEGEAWLTGKITPSGELDLSGTLENYRMELRGHLGCGRHAETARRRGQHVDDEIARRIGRGRRLRRRRERGARRRRRWRRRRRRRRVRRRCGHGRERRDRHRLRIGARTCRSGRGRRDQLVHVPDGSIARARHLSSRASRAWVSSSRSARPGNSP